MASRTIQPQVKNSDGTYDDLIIQQVANATNATNATNAANATKAQTIVYTTTPPTSSPAEGTLLIYIGSTLPNSRYDRVLYIITY